MPIYEYECSCCHHCFDLIQKKGDPAVTVCTECQGEAHRKFSPPAIIFKGSGFYATDSRRSDKIIGKEPKEKEETKSPSTTPDTKKEEPVKTVETKKETTKTEAKPKDTTSKNKLKA